MKMALSADSGTQSPSPHKARTNPIVDSGDKGVKSAWPCRINWTVASLPLSQIGPIFSRRSPVEPQPRRFAAMVRVAQATYPLSGVNRTFSRSVYLRCFFRSRAQMATSRHFPEISLDSGSISACGLYRCDVKSTAPGKRGIIEAKHWPGTGPKTQSKGPTLIHRAHLKSFVIMIIRALRKSDQWNGNLARHAECRR
jgi:hypothetical protein